MNQRTWDIQKDTPLVSVSLVTYNHAPYIRQCLEGILMQKTDFPFELLVHDDASTDGTSDIVKKYAQKYPNIIRAICQTENQWSQGKGISVTYQYPRARGKYIAWCEGDDYWIDSTKLQQQIDIMENNPKIGLVHTGGYDINVITGEKIDFYRDRIKNGDFVKLPEKIETKGRELIQNILLNYVILTASVCIRMDILNETIASMPEVFRDGKFMMGDTPTWFGAAMRANFGFIDKTMVTRHRLPVSASQNTDKTKLGKFRLNGVMLYKYFAEKFPEYKFCNELFIRKKTFYILQNAAWAKYDDIFDYLSENGGVKIALKHKLFYWLNRFRLEFIWNFLVQIKSNLQKN